MSQLLRSLKSIEDTVSSALIDYVQDAPKNGFFEPYRSLRDDLGIESLTLVSIILRIADELGVDPMSFSGELTPPTTVGDLLALGKSFQTSTSLTSE